MVGHIPTQSLELLQPVGYLSNSTGSCVITSGHSLIIVLYYPTFIVTMAVGLPKYPQNQSSVNRTERTLWLTRPS